MGVLGNYGNYGNYGNDRNIGIIFKLTKLLKFPKLPTKTENGVEPLSVLTHFEFCTLHLLSINTYFYKV